MSLTLFSNKFLIKSAQVHNIHLDSQFRHIRPLRFLLFLMFSGTHVMEGSGKILVVAVGLFSQTGIIYSLLGASQKDKTEDKKKDSSQDEGSQEDVASAGKTKSDEDEEQSVLQKKLTLIATQIGKVGKSSASSELFSNLFFVSFSQN
jgi:magnesium-transporting ATPase (P-type)